MRASFRVALGLAVLLVAVIGFAPATWLDRPLAARTQDRLRLLDAEGRWWNGRGSVATADGAARVGVAWRLNFAALLRGRLSIMLGRAGDESLPSGLITAHDNGIELRDLQLSVPARIVAAFVPPLQNLALGGDLSVQTSAFAWENASVSGTFAAHWRRARVVAGEAIVDLGTVALATNPPRGGRLAGTIRNDGGDVAVDGSLVVDAGAIDVAMTLAPGPSASDALRQALPMLGVPDGSGGVSVTWRSVR